MPSSISTISFFVLLFRAPRQFAKQIQIAAKQLFI